MIPIVPMFDEVPRMFHVVPIRRATARMLPLLCALHLLPAAALAAVQNTSVCTAPYDQFPPAIVANGTGGGLTAWADYRSADIDIFFQSTNSAGLPLWTQDGVALCKVAGPQINPGIAPDGDGGGVVVWQDGRPGTDYDIYSQRVSAFGQPVWSPGGIPVCVAAGVQEFPQVVADGLGGTIIGWVDRRGANADIYAQRLDASGIPQWGPNGVALCTATGDQTQVSLQPDGLGGAIALWKDERGGTPDLWAQRVSVGGVAQWAANGVVVCGAAGEQRDPQMVTDGAGGAIAVWSDARGGALDVYAQRMSGAGAAQWGTDGVPICAATGDQVVPRLCADGTGGVVVTWQDWRGGATSDIFAQRVTGAAGAAQWTAGGVAVCAAAADQTSPVVSSDEAGGAVISWSDGRTPINGMDIYAQRLSGAGAAIWAPNGVALCDTTGNQDSPGVIWTGAGGATAIWRDHRPGTTTDLYLQSVDGGGMVPGQCPAATTVLANGGLVTAAGAQDYYDVPVTDVYWSGVGVRSPAGTDWDIEFYGPNSLGLAPYPTCFGNPLAGSYGSGGVDFAIGNFNTKRTPLDTYGARATRYSGTGAGTVEWDLTATSIIKDCTGGNCGAKNAGNSWTGVLDVWDVLLAAGGTYTFDFTHTGNIKMLLFTSNGVLGPYFTSRGGAVFETTNHYTVYTAPASEFYGVALVNDDGLSSSYTVKVVTGIPVGVGDGAQPRTGLLGVTPNPAHGEAEVRFALSEPGEVSFRVLDMAGRVVGTIPGKPWGVGTWSLRWDGRGADGGSLAAGIYFLQMRLNGHQAGVQRLALVR